MTRPSYSASTPAPDMRWGFGWRPVMAVWNGLFHAPQMHQHNSTQSDAWNRGAELVNGLGHCGACHTERNVAGAEKNNSAYLQGAMVDGWQAPALTGLNHAPIPWSEEEFFRYLRVGHTEQHGVAAGPMGLVVRNLAAVPDEDLRAMAVYLASLQTSPEASPSNMERQADAVVLRAAALAPPPSAAQRQFIGSCGACHHDGDGPELWGQNRPLALNSNLHSDRPDNVLRIILEGIQAPASAEMGFMPSFAQALSDRQIVEMVNWMRARYAPNQPAWTQTEAVLKSMRRP